MKLTDKLELPHELMVEYKKAKRIEWFTIAYMLTVIVVMYLSIGSSQSMKVALIEDVLSLIPSISFLAASRYMHRKPNDVFPYGYHSANTIAFLCGSVALFCIGLFVCYDSLITLISLEHPTIGSFSFNGKLYWLGYLMYATLLYSSIPVIFLGAKKSTLAVKIHNKVLYTDADTQKADWMTAFAAIIGITGVGFGLWWADAVAALFIAGNILYEGYKNLGNAVADLLSSQPQSTDQKKSDKLLDEVKEYMESQSWIKDFSFRFRENGQIYFGEVFIVPNKEAKNVIEKVEELDKSLKELHWKIHDLTIMIKTRSASD